MDTPAAPRWKKRLLVIGGGLLAAVILLAAFAPAILSSVVRGLVAEAINRKIDGEVRIDGVSVSLGGSARISGFKIFERDGTEVVSIDAMSLQISLLQALTGSIRADATVEKPLLRLRKRADGTWNLPAMLRDGDSKGGGSGGGGSKSSGERPVQVRLAIREGVIVLEGTAAKTEFTKVAGRIDLSMGPEGMKVNLPDGTMTAGAGAIDLKSSLVLPSGTPSPSTFEVAWRRVGIDDTIRPLLGILHPLFAGGGIEGTIDGGLEVSHPGPLTMAALTGGWEAFPKESIDGKGRIASATVRVAGSPLLTELAGILGAGPDGIELKDLDYAIRSGRIDYGRPMRMTLRGVETTWSGTVGLDRTLDLAWEIPVTGRIVQRHAFLKSLEGKTFRVPLKGTIEKPQLLWKEAAAELATSAIKQEIEERLPGGIGGLLGGEREAGELLEQADRLWSEGKKPEAAALYRKLRDSHSGTVVYRLNRSRIKERAGSN